MVVDTSALVCILLAEAERPRTLARAIANAPENVIGAPTWVEASMVIAARLGE
jgi:uncharacterized protein with PIN domain